MNYPCAKFSDFIFSRFGFIVRTDRQTDRQTVTESQTESQTRMTAILTRLRSSLVILYKEEFLSDETDLRPQVASAHLATRRRTRLPTFATPWQHRPLRRRQGTTPRQ